MLRFVQISLSAPLIVENTSNLRFSNESTLFFLEEMKQISQTPLRGEIELKREH
jgi:hypothetical protein